MSYEPSQEDIYRADPYLAVQDMKAQLAAEKKDFDSLSDPELNKLADDYRVDVSQMQSQYTGIPGLGGKRIAQKTFAEIVRGDQKQKPRSTAPLGPSVGAAAPEPPPAAFESKDYSTLLQEKLAEMDLQREQVVVPDDVPPSTTTPAPESTAPRPIVKPVVPSSSSSTSSIDLRLPLGLSTVGRRTTLEENEALRKTLGVGEEEVSESVFDRIRSFIEDRLSERKPLSGLAPIEKGQEILQERLFQERDKTASLQDEMARGRDLKEQEDEVAREKTRGPSLLREAPTLQNEMDKALKKEAQPKSVQAPTFNDIVENRTRNAPKTGAAIAANEAQVGKAGSADRSSQTNIIKDYLNSMGYTKEMQTKFSKYFFDTFDQDVFFNQDVIIAALKMFNKEN